MLRPLDEWDPILHADLHVTDGAQFRAYTSLRHRWAHARWRRRTEEGRPRPFATS